MFLNIFLLLDIKFTDNCAWTNVEKHLHQFQFAKYARCFANCKVPDRINADRNSEHRDISKPRLITNSLLYYKFSLFFYTSLSSFFKSIISTIIDSVEVAAIATRQRASPVRGQLPIPPRVAVTYSYQRKQASLGPHDQLVAIIHDQARRVLPAHRWFIACRRRAAVARECVIRWSVRPPR